MSGVTPADRTRSYIRHKAAASFLVDMLFLSFSLVVSYFATYKCLRDRTDRQSVSQSVRQSGSQSVRQSTERGPASPRGIVHCGLKDRLFRVDSLDEVSAVLGKRNTQGGCRYDDVEYITSTCSVLLTVGQSHALLESTCPRLK